MALLAHRDFASLGCHLLHLLDQVRVSDVPSGICSRRPCRCHACCTAKCLRNAHEEFWARQGLIRHDILECCRYTLLSMNNIHLDAQVAHPVCNQQLCSRCRSQMNKAVLCMAVPLTAAATLRTGLAMNRELCSKSSSRVHCRQSTLMR